MPTFHKDQARVHLNLFQDEYLAIKKFARQHHISISSVIRMLIHQLIENQEELEKTNLHTEIKVVNEKITTYHEESNLIF